MLHSTIPPKQGKGKEKGMNKCEVATKRKYVFDEWMDENMLRRKTIM
jgi:hypothetical protein